MRTVEVLRLIHNIHHVSVPSPFHLRSVRLVCVHTVRRVQSPSGTACDRRSAIISIKYAASFFPKRQLAATALMFDEEEKNVSLSDKKKRMWVHKCFRSRKSESKYWTLYKEIADDEIKFYRYFRMSKHQFNYLLQKTGKDLKKKNTAFRDAISPVEKLATCLR
jgi:hypothetical protein